MYRGLFFDFEIRRPLLAGASGCGSRDLSPVSGLKSLVTCHLFCRFQFSSCWSAGLLVCFLQLGICFLQLVDLLSAVSGSRYHLNHPPPLPDSRFWEVPETLRNTSEIRMPQKQLRPSKSDLRGYQNGRQKSPKTIPKLTCEIVTAVSRKAVLSPLEGITRNTLMFPCSRSFGLYAPTLILVN